MNEQGLAAQGQMQQGPTIEQMVQKVAELLAQGVTAEQLMQQGVPQEIIDMAMQLLQSQQGQQQPQAEPVQGGLASRGMM
jgi:hypothetical protein